MIRKPSDIQAIGFHLNGTRLQVAHLAMTASGPKVKRLEEISLSSSNLDESTLSYQNKGDEALVREFMDKYLTSTAFTSPDLLTRRLRIRLLKEKEIQSAFPFEAESQIPYSISDAILDKIPLEKEGDSSFFTLIAAKKKSISEALDRLKSLDIDPEILVPSAVALAAFATQYAESSQKILVLHVGLEELLSTVVEEGKLLSSHMAQLGISLLQKGYESDQSRDPELLETPFESLDFQGEDLALAPLLQQAIAKLRKEIEWLLVSEISALEERGEERPTLLITGDVVAMKGLLPLLSSGIDLAKTPLTYKEGLEESFLQFRKNSLAIGSALIALEKYPFPINLRQEELAFSQPWRRFKKTIALIMALSLLLSFLIFLLGQAQIGLREDDLKIQFAEALAEAHISYAQFDKEFQAAVHKKAAAENEEPPSLKSLSQEELQKRIAFLQKKLSLRPEYFALSPNVPSVSDFLAWLTSLPPLQRKEDSIQIESLSYSLVKRPEMNKKGEHYQVKIDLEISALTPKIAREFHNLLIEPNDFIDPKGEVKWGQSKGTWRTSFYLKDKTLYPKAS